ncbi:hypothetical protein [Henriciella litoralis]|uniref:hypothetical protein n=1 Tax=Henriciella litoralis TaxID=568102 RepID=UPI0009FBB615|nr:hypothetical protein [Henriciella litoralis]
MSEDNKDTDDAIDAEFEPADSPQEAEDAQTTTATATPVEPEKKTKTSGPGWLSFGLVSLIALGSLGLSVWSSGLFETSKLPSTTDTELAALTDREADLRKTVEGLSTDIDKLETRLGKEIGDLDARIADAKPSTQTAAPDNSGDLAALKQRLSRLETRLTAISSGETSAGVDPDRVAELETAIQSASGASAQQLAALQSDIQTLRTELDAVKSAQSSTGKALAQLKKSTQQIGDNTARTVGASILFTSIETAAARGEPFAEPYRELSQLMPDDPDVKALAQPASSPVPTRAELKQSFEDLAEEARHADPSGTAQPGWIDNIFGGTVSVRRSSADSPTAKQLDTARQALARGDLKAATSALNDLPAEPRNVLAPWLADAQRRLQLEQSLDALRLKLITARQ